MPVGSTSETPPGQSTEPAPQGRSFRRHRSSARELVCIVTEMTTQQDQYPTGYCTHLVYSDVVYDPKHRKFLATKNDKSFELFKRNQRVTNMSHLVALNPHQTLNVYLNGLTDIEVQWYFVQMIESLMNDYQLDGVAFIGIELSLDNVQQFSRVIDRMKEALKKKPSRQFFQLVFGGFVTDLDNDPAEIANRIRVIAEEVDIFIIETHYQRPLPLCKTVFPTAFNNYGSFTPNVPINTGLNWLKALVLPRTPKGRKSICMSLSMVALLFKVSGTVDHLQPGNACFEEIWMNYAETCIGHGWSNVKTHSSAMSSFRHKIKFWQSFDTDITVTRKVDLILDQANKTCFAAYYVDYEDYYGMCQGKVAFPRLKAIRDLLNKRTNVDEDIDLFGHDF
ncbi:chitinase-3-like protein 1 [Dermacentor andersoni]|uniref:chitinase-3-like protein 1 n=2 Tax=Dermacentor TaxID=34619 RepID=UPI0024162E58|nr:chitinase-3-like protein 1 [Dermacentor andersoni]